MIQKPDESGMTRKQEPGFSCCTDVAGGCMREPSAGHCADWGRGTGGPHLSFLQSRWLTDCTVCMDTCRHQQRDSTGQQLPPPWRHGAKLVVRNSLGDNLPGCVHKTQHIECSRETNAREPTASRLRQEPNRSHPPPRNPPSTSGARLKQGAAVQRPTSSVSGCFLADN